MDRWEGKVAIVTGASAGIGAAVCEKLVAAGVQVVGLARRKDRMEELAKKFKHKTGKLYPFQADMTNEEDILAAFKWITENLGPVHILVNNAGIGKATTLLDGKTADFRTILDTNVLALTITTREAIKNMRANNVNGHVIHINSVMGHAILNVPDMNIYPASKYAVTALTETLRQELVSIRSNIKVTSVSPGVVDTEIFEASGYLETQSMVDILGRIQKINSVDVADAIIYILGTPPHVQISELTIQPVLGFA